MHSTTAFYSFRVCWLPALSSTNVPYHRGFTTFFTNALRTNASPTHSTNAFYLRLSVAPTESPPTRSTNAPTNALTTH
jgi:hypothetical protein